MMASGKSCLTVTRSNTQAPASATLVVSRRMKSPPMDVHIRLRLLCRRWEHYFSSGTLRSSRWLSFVYRKPALSEVEGCPSWYQLLKTINHEGHKVTRRKNEAQLF